MDQNPKQQVAEKLRSSANVLVTVSKNPSVDQLAAAIGLSLMLNSLGKHVATVFSGQIPDIISFLEPEKTFEDTVDGLRDFIISLDKEKADKLRYKVEDDVVKIFITPYRTKISDTDLKFEQGDFNVDAVVALGVRKKADLDEAITAHGRILHDATVIAVNTGESGGGVGSIKWDDDTASSLCEMLVSISEALEGGILDDSMSTALLTGIVSVTDRFSNSKTTPKLMTMAAQLMAAGANQQLISEKLNLADVKQGSSPEQAPEQAKAAGKIDKSGKKDDLILDLEHMDGDKSEAKNQKSSKKPEKDKKEEGDASLEDASKGVKLDELEKQLQEATDTPQKTEEPKPPQPKPQSQPSPPPPPPAQPKIDPVKQSEPEGTDLQIDEDTGELRNVKAQTHLDGDRDLSPPSMGGTFNATSKVAHNEKEVERQEQLNNELLTHGPKEPIPSSQPPQPQTQLPPQPQPEEGLDDARQAVEQAMSGNSFDPANNPVQGLNAQPLTDGLSINQSLPPQPPGQQQVGPPTSPPPMPPPMSPPPANQERTMLQQQQGPTPNPAFNPVMNSSNPAQTFNIPGQRPGMPPPQPMNQPPQPQPMPPQGMGQPNVPPPPPPSNNFPPPPA